MTHYSIHYKSKACKYHVIWCPKYLRTVLVGDVDARLKELAQEVCAELGSDLMEMKVMPDPVHLVVETDPQFGIHRLVKQIKSRSSSVLRREFPHLKSRLPTLWTNHYLVATGDSIPPEVVRQYIEQQKQV